MTTVKSACLYSLLCLVLNASCGTSQTMSSSPSKPEGFQTIYYYFEAECGAVRVHKPVFQRMVKIRGISNVQYVKYGTEQGARLMNDFGINTFPTIALIENGRIKDMLVGTRGRLDGRVLDHFFTRHTEGTLTPVETPSEKLAKRNRMATGDVLRGLDLSGSYFQKGDLSGTDLRDTKLVGTDLRFTNLAYANLSGANLTGVKSEGTFWRGATCPDGRVSEGEKCTAD